MTYKNSNTHWLAVYISNDDLVNAQSVIGLPDVDHDMALLEVIRSQQDIFSNGIRIIERIVNGYLITDPASIIKECVLWGKTAILALVIDKYTTINRDWFYYAFSQLVENRFAATRPHNTARWVINYAAEHDITIQTNDIVELLTLADSSTVHAALDAVYDNTGHYQRLISYLLHIDICDLDAVVLKWLYDNGKRAYTTTEYAGATLRAFCGLVCK